MSSYTVKPSELANAFDRAALFMAANKPRKMYTMDAALRYAVGHDLRVFYACRNVIRKSLGTSTTAEWLIANGVPEPEVRGMNGFRNVRAWKLLWMQKLADQFARASARSDKPYPFTYPF